MTGIGDVVEGDGRYCGGAGCLGAVNSSRSRSSSSRTSSSNGVWNVDCELGIEPNAEMGRNSSSLKITSREMINFWCVGSQSL